MANDRVIKCAPRSAIGFASKRRRAQKADPYAVTEERWDEDKAKAFFDDLVSENREALHGLAKL